MDNLFITDLHIAKIRHLKNVDIHICGDKRKNLIITGKNGSGKTSVLEAVIKTFSDYDYHTAACASMIDSYTLHGIEKILTIKFSRSVEWYEFPYKKDYFFIYFPAKRTIKYEINPNIVKPEIFKGKYFHTFLVHMKVQEKFEDDNGDTKKWFDRFENMLKEIYKDNTLELIYDHKNYTFFIKLKDREPFNFNQFSDGYSSIIEIISDIIMLMEERNNMDYGVQGIALIDEIETHLHLELQKFILPFLTSTFPNIQFIVTTHSPLVITSDPNAVIFDLEHQKHFEDLTDFSYEGVVEGYFNVDKISIDLKNDFERYKSLLEKLNKSNEDINEITKLESRLDEVPDLLNLDFAAEYTQLKFSKEFE